MSQNIYNTTVTKLNNLLSITTENSYVSSFILLFFISYGSFIGSGGKPPKFIIDIFSNPAARIIFLAIVAYQANRDIQTSLLMSLAFFLTQQYIFKQETFEQIKSLEKFQNMYYISSISEDKNNSNKIS